MADVKKPEDDKTITDNKTPANEAPTTDKPAAGDNVVTYDFNARSQAAQGKNPQGDKPPAEKPKEDKPPARRGRPPNPNKVVEAENPDNTKKSEKPPKPPKEKSGASAGGGKTSKAAGEEKPKSAATIEKAPETPPPPPVPTQAPRTGEQEQIVYINLSELYPFKDHPFQVKQDAEMLAMVESVKDKGVTQPAIVRPREDGGYELVSGHRRHMASELSNYTNMPCIVRNLT